MKQLDLFDAEPAPVPLDPIIGLSVRMPSACLRCRCRLATIVAGSGPHQAGLSCAGCGVHRGWISHETLRFLQNFVATFGRPTRPIDFRHVKRGGAMRQK